MSRQDFETLESAAFWLFTLACLVYLVADHSCSPVLP